MNVVIVGGGVGGLNAAKGFRRAAVEVTVLRRRVPFTGFIAWALCAGVHVFFLIGFRSRLMVLLEWIWACIFLSRRARLITEQGLPRRPG